MAEEKHQSDLKRAFSEDGPLKTHVGGQALLEGIMMRGKYNWSVAVREPDGNIYVEEHDLSSGKERNRWMYWPLIRGCRALVESFTLGLQGINIAADHAFPEEDEDDKASSKKSIEESGSDSTKNGESAKKESSSSVLVGIALAIGLIIGIALFIALPAFLTNLIVGDYGNNPLAWNILDGVIRVAIFIFYFWLMGRAPDVKRIFSYHGAEHKTIHCYEHGLELTPENARSFPRLHVRCGTAFLIMVMIIAIFIYTVIPVGALIDALGVPEGAARLALLIGIRILLLPIIAGLSYEITVKWAGSHPDNPLVKVILWPGMQMQYLTTNEPDDEQLACAIAAMQKVLERERLEEAKAVSSSEAVAQAS